MSATEDLSLEKDDLTVMVVGLGYVGVTATACLLEQGHSVIGVDINPSKVDAIARGLSPITEPKVSEMLLSGCNAGRLQARTTIGSVAEADAIIVCVGTPSAADGSHNMSFILECTRQIAESVAAHDPDRLTVAYRSTVRPGTVHEMIEPLFRSQLGERFRDVVEIVYNPEFLREGTAVDDYFNPPKVVLGTHQGERSYVMGILHKDIDAPVFETPYREAEITKFVDNSWHAVKVTFANEIGRVSAAYGVDSQIVHEIFAADTKLNLSAYYTRPGGPFGGSCLPKDVRALNHIADQRGVKCQLITSILNSNQSHKDFQYQRVADAAESGSRILVAGLAFKAGTDDLRESPNLDLVARLNSAGYRIRVFDPDVAKAKLIGQNLGHALAALPEISELLVAREDIRAHDYDLLVINNATAKGLPELNLPCVDLRTI